MGQEHNLLITESHSWKKILAILSFISLVVALLIAHQHPATGYEPDIYASTPALTWVFIFLAIIGGTIIVIDQVITKSFKRNRFWLLGVLILVLSQISFLYIPYIRDYFTWGGDNLSHWGEVEDILNNGHFSQGNFYPITHSILSQIILITKAPLQVVTNLSTTFLSVFFIAFTYLLATVVLAKREQQLIATAVAAIVLIEGGYHVFLMPNGWSIFLIPLLFYLYFKNQSERSYIIPFIILLVLYPFFHPLSSLMIGITFIVIYFTGLFTKSLRNRVNSSATFATPIFTLVFGIVELLILIFWIRQFSAFKTNFHDLWQNIFTRTGQVLGQMGLALSKVQIHGLDLIVLYLKLYGADTALIIFSLLGLMLFFRQIKKIDQGSFSIFIASIGFIFLLFSFIYVLYLIGLFGLGNIAAERMISYIMIFTPELAAIGILWVSQKIKLKFLNIILIVAFLIILSGLSLRELYYSPYIVQPNAQVTATDMEGFEWFIKEKNSGIGILNIGNPPSPFYNAILGSDEASQRYDDYNIQFSDHFGYNEYNTLGEQYSGE